MATYPDQLQPFSLNGSGAIASATTVVLKSMTDIDGNLVTMAKFGTVGYGTLEPGSGTMEEQISFSGISQNANGTATLTGVKSVTFGQPFTETSGLSKTHAGSTTFVISNTSGFYGLIPFKANDETITGQWTFDTFPITPSVPVATTTVAGSVELATDAEVLAKSSTGSVGPLVVQPSQLASTLLSDYKADTGTANTYVITPVPAITGYTNGQTFSFKATNANTGTSTLAVSGLAAKTIKLPTGSNVTSGDIIAGQIVVVEYDGTNFQMVSPAGNLAIKKFGGTGADGALTITSGTTTIDLGSAAVVVKNYSSISITGTGALGFSNPNANGTIVILKSRGDVTITSSATPAIDMRGLGSTGGTGGATTANGIVGTAAGSTIVQNVIGGGPGTKNASGVAGVTFASGAQLIINGKHVPLSAGAGGGGGAGGGEVSSSAATAPGGGGGSNLINSGSASTNGTTSSTSGSGGAGGRGAGALYIEVGGSFSNSGIINAAGTIGTAATTQGGGGGGGAGGVIVILYNTLTSDTGTYTLTAGAGGAGAGTGGTGGAGATGVSLVTANTEFD